MTSWDRWLDPACKTLSSAVSLSLRWQRRQAEAGSQSLTAELFHLLRAGHYISVCAEVPGRHLSLGESGSPACRLPAFGEGPCPLQQHAVSCFPFFKCLLPRLKGSSKTPQGEGLVNPVSPPPSLQQCYRNSESTHSKLHLKKLGNLCITSRQESPHLIGRGRLLGQQTGTGLVINTESFASSPCHSSSVLTEAARMSYACSWVATGSKCQHGFEGIDEHSTLPSR